MYGVVNSTENEESKQTGSLVITVIAKGTDTQMKVTYFHLYLLQICDIVL